ncbi:MAG: tyrosine-type recombinase/integrase [Rhizomicrobium sp.]
MVKLTKRAVNDIKPSQTDQVVFDEELAGFGVRVKPSGARSWLIQYRNKHGRSRRYTIGAFSKFTPKEARKKATRLFVAISDGADPAHERGAARTAVTVAQLCDEYLAAGKGRIKASTLLMDASRVERHVKPLLGSRAVASLTHADMEKFLRDVMAGKSVAPRPKSADINKTKRPKGGVAKGGPGVASRTLGMLGTILERAVRDGALAKNPVRGIKRPKDQAAAPPFSFEKVKALGNAMRAAANEDENVKGLAAIRLLLLTGFRRMEALTLKWGMIDVGARCTRFDDTKSGKQVRALGRSALAHLASVKPDGAKSDDFVFATASKAGHLVGLPHIWKRTAERAKLEGVTLHGLRHWFASAATELGYSDLIIGALLGHAKRGITGRYATAPDPALIAAADRIAVSLANALDGTDEVGTVLRFG